MKKYFVFPLSIILLAIGVFAGMKIQNAVSDDKLNQQLRKYKDALEITSRYYVDDVDSQKLTEDAIKGMLEGLDPHSVYISAEQLKRVNEDFQGSFEGIGVEFDIVNDTLTIVSPISGGPSEKLGILAGDKIVKIDGQSSVKIARDDVPKKLKGPKGTKVNITVIRPGLPEPLEFEITRDKIPIYSVDASFMFNDEIGYVKVSRFSATTYEEFIKSLAELKSKGMKKLVLDLRGDPGGFLDQAFKMASEFIPAGKKIVYTKSRISDFNEEFVSQGGNYTDIPLVVLVNGGSASASEIVSGAVQDWDRGLIVGETTFGKGLVQRQFDLPDGSAFRVTTARYYTPSGRLIQKPYDGAKYRADSTETGEGDNLYHSNDSRDTTKPVFRTNGGRTVYGGGGITPDYVIKSDTLTQYSVQLRRLNLFYIAAENFMSNNRKQIEQTYKSARQLRDEFDVPQSVIDDLRKMADEKDVPFNEEQFQADLDFIKTSIKTQIARDIWGNNGAYEVFLGTDEQFLKSAGLFEEAIELAKLKQ
ncbi:MAG: S41 family peptidase [Ignavibacteria bacterium]|nr:S41 family peptidase [Ignavibacteria bacterium]